MFLYRIFLMFLVCVYLIGCVDSKGIPEEQEVFLINCLQHRTDNEWIRSLPGRAKTRKCRRFLRRARESNAHRGTRRFQGGRLLGNSVFSYLSALINWKNEEGTLSQLLLDRVSPCHYHSKPLQNYWNGFFSRRHDPVAVSPVTLNQSWIDTRGQITLRPSKSKYSADQLVAAELVLSRVRPSDISEQFGRYNVKVTMNGHNRTVDLYSDSQTSCPAENGNLMALDLTVPELANWHRNGDENLVLSVEVDIRRQYFNPLATERHTVNVVERIAGLVLHFRRTSATAMNDSSESRQRLRTALAEVYRVPNQAQTSTSTRQDSMHTSNSLSRDRPRRRRSTVLSQTRSRQNQYIALNIPQPPRSTHQCRITSFYVNQAVSQYFNISWPEGSHRHWDIKECTGMCEQGMEHGDVSNHAITTSMDPAGDVCCVPTQYRTLHYVKVIDEEVHLYEIPDMVATQCACR